jgi:hypothetical protein
MTLSRGQTFSGDVPHDIVRFGIRCASAAQTAFDKLIQNGSQLLLRFKVTGDTPLNQEPIVRIRMNLFRGR